MTNSTSKKRILIVNKYFDQIGGIEAIVRSLARIEGENLEITILSLGDPKNTATLSAQFPHARIIILPIAGILFRMPLSFRFFSVFLREVRKTDVIHLHSSFPLVEWYYVLLSFFITMPAKLLVTWHADILKPSFFVSLHHFFLKRIFKNAFTIIVTSPTILENTTFLQPYISKVQVIPLGVKDTEYRHSSTTFTYALFVGRLVYYKGLEYLIDALIGTKIKVVIVGDGPLKEKLEQRAVKNNVIENIIWKGAVSDEELNNLYELASVLVFPSVEITEAFGLVQAEALSYGLPVINTTLPTGVPWVARNNQEAITVPIKDVDALRTALQTISTDGALRQKLGIQGRKRYEELFTEEAMKEQYKKLYLD